MYITICNEPKGNCEIASDTSTNSIGTLNPFRYRGYYFDTETELYYLQSRYYDPWLTRNLINVKIREEKSDNKI